MSIRVLVVEDHPIMRVGIAAMLGRYAEINVVGLVGSGEEAVGAYASLRPDIVLLDLRLPGMGGVEVLEKIIALHAAARVIILTTYEGGRRYPPRHEAWSAWLPHQGPAS